MKFESDKMVKGRTLHFDVPFDPELLTKVTIDEEDVCLLIEYELRGVSMVSHCSIVFEPTHVITLTNDDVYWETALTLSEGTPSEMMKKYLDDYGTIGFHVKLTQEEKIRVLLAITKSLMK